MNELLVKMKYLYPSLTRAEKEVEAYIEHHISSIPDMTLYMLSEESKTSEATILRFCRKLGYSSYVQFKHDCAAYGMETSPDSKCRIHRDDRMEEIFEKLLSSVTQSLRNTRILFSEKSYEQALQAILQANQVVFVATGDAVSICELASAKFNRVGIRAFVCSNTAYQYETTMRLTGQDVLIALSASGHSHNIVQSAKLAKNCGATVISITQSAKSPLLLHTNISLITSSLDMTTGRDSICKRVSELLVLESFYLGIIARGPLNYNKMLQCTLASFELNSD